MNNNTVIRTAKPTETALILELIKELALYEKMSDEVTATEELLNEWIFEKKKAEVLFAEYNGKVVGMALYFYNFSTFLAKAGIYLEDLYVKPEFRGKGLGKALFRELAGIAVKNECGRLEWSCLDWNKPSIEFYLALGAKPMDGWTVYRISGSKLGELGMSNE